MEGELYPLDAAMAKMFTSELHCETVDECLQLFGGWGYMWEYPIARAYVDARVVEHRRRIDRDHENDHRAANVRAARTLIQKAAERQRHCLR